MKLLIAAGLCALLATSTPAYAVKFGFGLAGSSGTGEASDNSYEYDEESGEIDFVLNIGAAKRAINWRFNLGFVAGESEITRPATGATNEFDGLIINNTLGVRLFHNEPVRLWLGPTINLGFLEAQTSSGTFISDLFAFGIGPTLGIDIELPKRAPTIGAELNLRFINVSYDDPDIGDEDVVDVLARVTLMWGS